MTRAASRYFIEVHQPEVNLEQRSFKGYRWVRRRRWPCTLPTNARNGWRRGPRGKPPTVSRDVYGEFKTLITDYNAYTTCKKHCYTVPEHLRSSHNSTFSTVSSGFTVPKRTKRAIALFQDTTQRPEHQQAPSRLPGCCPSIPVPGTMHALGPARHEPPRPRSQAAPPASRGPVR